MEATHHLGKSRESLGGRHMPACWEPVRNTGARLERNDGQEDTRKWQQMAREVLRRKRQAHNGLS